MKIWCIFSIGPDSFASSSHAKLTDYLQIMSYPRYHLQHNYIYKMNTMNAAKII
jgi:hypothetical protein